ncbi:hypothetical protein ACHAXR_005555 [Thalassiosira sp. AJA248-18]
MSNECNPLIGSRQRAKRWYTNVPYPLALSSVAAILVLLIISTNQQHGERKSSPSLIGSSEDDLSPSIQYQHQNSFIRPGSIFLDTKGIPINAHGGGFLFLNDTYYWYGEIKSGPTYLPDANADWGGTRVDLTGISCYSSKDLLNWENLGNVLPAVSDPDHDLYIDKVAERPKVVYNGNTGKFVMWLHVDSMDYKRARCGVAISDRPDGPFEYIGSFRPNGKMARDLTVFVDDDESSTAYLFTSSEDNAAIHVSQLSDDYQSTTGNCSRIFVNRYMEAPTIFKHNGKYYFIGSGCTAWNPNAARSAVASSIWGPWEELGNPCRGEDANTTFHSQSTYVLPVNGRKRDGSSNRFVFAADRWNEGNLSSSQYVWLPLTFDDESGNPVFEWQVEWSPA